MARSFLFLLPCIALMAVSCRHTPTAEEQDTIDAILNARRHASLGAWQGKNMNGLEATSYASHLTTLVLPPHAQLKMKHVRQPDGRHILRVTAKGKDLFCGSAVPLTRDGYFLTAAHNLESADQLILLLPAENDTAGKAFARLVWKGQWQKDGPDLALLHAPLHPLVTATIADPVCLRRRTPVMASGYSGNRPVQGGGLILRLGRMKSTDGGPRWRRLSHNAPLAAGDSGGPLLGDDGRLLGINTGFYSPWALPFGYRWIPGYQGVATAPDPAGIQSLIDQDRLSLLPARMAKKKS